MIQINLPAESSYLECNNYVIANNIDSLQTNAGKDTSAIQNISPSLSVVYKKNPNTALFLSALPGGGQFYTHNYLKAGIFALSQGVAAGITTYLLVQRNNAQKRGDTWDADYYYNEAYNWFWIDGVVWSLSMMDAYVSAHFYKFREQATLEIGFRFK